MRRIFLDTEFTQLPWDAPSELLWVGLVDEAGRRWSAACDEVDDADCSDFVREQVLPLLSDDEPRLSRAELATRVVQFCGDVEEFWAWFPSADDVVSLGAPPPMAVQILQRYADWDYQLLCGLVAGHSVSWPQHCRDVHALARRTGITLPTNPLPHHPAHDAAWNREVFLRATRR